MKPGYVNLGLRIVLFCSILFPLPLSGQITWQTINSTSYHDNRDENAYVELHGKFYLIGGAYQGLTKVQEYDPATNLWTDKGNVPEGFHHFQGVAYDSLIWVLCSWKGTYGAEQNLSHIYTYEPINDVWTQGMPIPLARQRGSAGVVVDSGRFYIIGGNSGGHGTQGEVKNWVDVYDPAANGGLGSWDTLAPMPIGRDHFQAVIKNGKIYAIGGRDSGAPGNFFTTIRPQVDIYDIATNTWTTLPASANLPTLRAGSSNVLMDDDIYVMLGVGSSSTNERADVEAFNINTHSWRVLPPAPHSRSGTQAVPFGRNIFVASGLGSVYGGTDLYEQDKLYIPPPGSVTLTVTKPNDVSTVADDSAVFDVLVYNSNTPLSFQWQRLNPPFGWQNIPGATQASYTLPAVTTADDSSYFRVQVMNSTDTVFSDSALLTVSCGGVFYGVSDPIVMEAEHFHESYIRNGQSWQLSNQAGAVGQMLEAGPNNGSNFNTNYTSQSPETQYDIDFSQSGTYYVWVRTWSPTFEDNSFHAAIDSVITGSSDKITYDTYQQWGWTNHTMDGHLATFDVQTVGVHRLHLWMREDGVRIDRILLTRNSNYVPSGQGPAESSFCNPTTAFPIELGNWSVQQEEKQVKLSWTTLREHNNNYFSIEKRTGNQRWNEIGTITGAGNSSIMKAYSFYDPNPYPGLNYYRLRQIDFDGSFTYSKALSIAFDHPYIDMLQAFPNPLKSNVLTVRFGHDGEKSELILRNVWGVEVVRKSILFSQDGVLEDKLILPDLAKGIYFLELESKHAIKAVKIIIQ